jgi:hypothetical protein
LALALALVLAQVAALPGQAVFGDAQNGLFLAAPRRTGKSTFLQGDLKPALEAAGVVVVCVDLWADARRDAGSLIAGRLLQAFEVFGYRPQVFMEALGQALSSLSGVQGVRFEQRRKEGRWPPVDAPLD